MLRDEERRQLRALIDAIVDPETKEHYRSQLSAAERLEDDGLLDDRLPMEPVLRGKEEPHVLTRTYVFQWFRGSEGATLGPGGEALCEQLVVHTAGTEKALALFEQNAASGTLVHTDQLSPRCEILSLDADDCRTCFGAGKLTKQGKQREPCDVCGGSGKKKGRFSNALR